MDLLEERFKAWEGSETYKAYWEKEGWPFFVKNLENVQGDERDVIYISTTFGKAPGTTVVRQNIGPISRPMGWRRLNVLFTRARKSLHVFSSMLPEDIVIDHGTPEGTKALRNYLEYAIHGHLGTANIGEREPDSDFEIAVADVLRTHGYDVTHQVGVAGFFLDLGVRDPDRPGEYLAAIECDGATYHSAGSVRARDRIRQEILEALGWKDKIWRIWSPDWFRNPRGETVRLLQFLKHRQDRSRTEWPIESDVVEMPTERATPDSVSEQLSLLGRVSEDEELFVEVGDLVTFNYLDEPTRRVALRLTSGPTNREAGLLNENAPLAQVLLGLGEGDEADLVLSEKERRRIKVLRIRRGETKID